MNITKQGNPVIIAFKCPVCDCEFEEEANKCHVITDKCIDGTTVFSRAEHDCPNCKVEVCGFRKVAEQPIKKLKKERLFRVHGRCSNKYCQTEETKVLTLSEYKTLCFWCSRCGNTMSFISEEELGVDT